VGDVLEVPQLGLRTGNHQQVVVASAVALRFRITGIERLDAVDEIPITPELRAERSDRHGPHAAVVPGHFQVGRAVQLPFNRHFGRARSGEPERHRPVRMNLRRPRDRGPECRCSRFGVAGDPGLEGAGCCADAEDMASTTSAETQMRE